MGDCDSARVTSGGGELGSEMSTFEVDDVSDDIRSSVSNGFSSSKASMVGPDGDYIAQDAENDVCLGAASSQLGCSRIQQENSGKITP